MGALWLCSFRALREAASDARTDDGDGDEDGGQRRGLDETRGGCKDEDEVRDRKVRGGLQAAGDGRGGRDTGGSALLEKGVVQSCAEGC